jgi:hypothetical protein
VTVEPWEIQFSALFRILKIPNNQLSINLGGGTYLMEERNWKRGTKHSYTDRPLTEEERTFAEKNHACLFYYMRAHNLNSEEWYDILVIPYLDAVKKYFNYDPCKEFAFPTVLNKKLDTAVGNYWRARNRKKRMPEGGFTSLDYLLEGDNLFSTNTAHEDWWIDTRASVERQVIQKELYKEFYQKCITVADDIDGYEEVCEFLKFELDLLIDGYNHKQAHRETEKHFNYGYSYNDFERDVEGFRRIFKQVFGI